MFVERLTERTGPRMAIGLPASESITKIDRYDAIAQ
jgi:hypothetical protein